MNGPVGEVHLWLIPFDVTWDGHKWVGQGADELNVVAHRGFTFWPVRLFVVPGPGVAILIKHEETPSPEVIAAMAACFPGEACGYIAPSTHFVLATARIDAHVKGELYVPTNETGDGPVPLTNCGYQGD
jgi:hypothetical protein